MLFVSVWRRWRSAFIIAEATNIAARHDYVNALRVLSKFFRLYKASGPSHKIPLLANMFLADLNGKIDDKISAYVACKVSLKQIRENSGPDGAIYSKNDLNYLAYRCKWILSRLSERLDSEEFALSLSIGITFESLELHKTSKLIKDIFPINIIEGAALDLFISQNQTRYARITIDDKN